MNFRDTARRICTMIPLPGVIRKRWRPPVKEATEHAGSIPAPAAAPVSLPVSLLNSHTLAASYVQFFRSKPDYDEWMGNNLAILNARHNRELTVMPALAATFSLTGYCAACESIQPFVIEIGANNDQTPFEYSAVNWRESLLCGSCGLNNRMRASVDLFSEQVKADPSCDVYITEQVTPLYAWAKRRYPGVTGSEYLGDDKVGGATYEGIRHEDTTRLSFGSGGLDWVLSFDVLEHIPDFRGALREIFRCLRPGGALLLSAPFVSDLYRTRVRARHLPDGSIEHILPAEYHGNPTQPGSGSLCYYHFGWDLLDELTATGFTDAQVIAYYSFARGNFGNSQLFFWARK